MHVSLTASGHPATWSLDFLPVTSTKTDRRPRSLNPLLRVYRAQEVHDAVNAADIAGIVGEALDALIRLSGTAESLRSHEGASTLDGWRRETVERRAVIGCYRKRAFISRRLHDASLGTPAATPVPWIGHPP